MAFQKICLAYNSHRENGLTLLESYEHVLAELGKQSIRLPLGLLEPSKYSNDELASVDLVIAFGGDGTLLNAARIFSKSEACILGINTGNLGFLSEAHRPIDIKTFLNNILNGQFIVDPRTMLSGEIIKSDQSHLSEGEKNISLLALNDIVISRSSRSHILRVNLDVDDSNIAQYAADGVIICTPTGSTAYSLAAGGAVLAPNIQGIGITPICPHSLTSRPLVISDSSVLKISITPRNRRQSLITVQADGQEIVLLEPDDLIVIKKADFKTKLIRSISEDNSFYRILSKSFYGGVQADMKKDSVNPLLDVLEQNNRHSLISNSLQNSETEELDSSYTEPKLKEACGVVGIIFKNGYEHKDKTEASYLTYLALNALQHRGQESCGIASFDDLSQKCYSVLEMGLISQAFSEEKLESLKGHLAIGHVRYSTAGQSEICNAQPIIKNSKNFGYTALAHNGNLVNSTLLIERVESKGYFRQSNSDSELLSYLMKEFINSKETVEVLEALRLAYSEAKGAFSLSVALGGKFLVGVRDHQGLRPLELGAIEENGEIIAYVLVSETCGLDIMGAKHIREVQPGEILLIDESLNLHSTFLSNVNPKLCLFELIYFARPDSIMKGIQVNEYREELGRILALNSPVPHADVVVGVPDSGTPAAIGFSKQSGIPFVQGLIKNRYVGRTFIQPTQSIRQLGIKLKLNPLPNVIRGKSVVLVDDSIVRGNTPSQLVKLLKQAGAKEVHLRISSPPIMWGCFYGIAMKSDELIARRLEGQIERILNEVGADSLAYLDLENALKVTNRNQKEFCTACFNGDYPVFVSDQSAEKENAYLSIPTLHEGEPTQAVLT